MWKNNRNRLHLAETSRKKGRRLRLEKNQKVEKQSSNECFQRGTPDSKLFQEQRHDGTGKWPSFGIGATSNQALCSTPTNNKLALPLKTYAAKLNMKLAQDNTRAIEDCELQLLLAEQDGILEEMEVPAGKQGVNREEISENSKTRRNAVPIAYKG